MIPESRDESGKLRTGYFIALGKAFKSEKGYYDQSEFKEQIEQSGVLKDEDWLSDGTHKHTWRHRVERATQNIRTGV
ncbi:MAG TPA: hypothetical protein VK815_05635 [Candidatus Acidoferrales bacterium]|jgi:hypothetical protein|nr:hypothetical protein [Candidatus Acidoferrales bacterium]